MTFDCAAKWFSLSPGERAGVRGNGASKCIVTVAQVPVLITWQWSLEPSPLVWRTNLGLRGLTALPISFTTASPQNQPGVKADSLPQCLCRMLDGLEQCFDSLHNDAKFPVCALPESLRPISTPVVGGNSFNSAVDRDDRRRSRRGSPRVPNERRRSLI